VGTGAPASPPASLPASPPPSLDAPDDELELPPLEPDPDPDPLLLLLLPLPLLLLEPEHVPALQVSPALHAVPSQQASPAPPHAAV
jgi:hypothetical protein